MGCSSPAVTSSEDGRSNTSPVAVPNEKMGHLIFSTTCFTTSLYHKTFPHHRS